MIEITNKSLCCGCTACVSTCPVDALTMAEDSEGFLYPVADKETCINCGLCDKVCPFLNPSFQKNEPIHCMALQHKDKDTLQNSSSGGAFSILAEYVISKGGVVFGAAFDDKWKVAHTFARSMDETKAFRGSKYVQSNMGDTFPKIKAMLSTGMMVLFTGTPCQVAGLKRFLKKEYDNLITMDFICHGIPSPKAWKFHLDEVAHGKRIRNINFRDKSTGWKRYSNKIDLEDKALYQKADESAYMKAFLSDRILRPSCYSCTIKADSSYSDLTIGDFWGIDKIYPDFDDDRGCSAVMFHSNKALDIFKASDNFRSIDVSFEEICRYNPSATQSVSKPYRREKFLDIMIKTGKLSIPVRLMELKKIIYRIRRKISRS